MLNTHCNINQNFIDARVACHPVRLLADCKDHMEFSQPLITPYSMLPETIKRSLPDKKIFDFGIKINNNFGFHNNYCELPSLLVIAYSLAVANSGQADQIILAGFDGYDINNPKRLEMDQLFLLYNSLKSKCEILKYECIELGLIKIDLCLHFENINCSTTTNPHGGCLSIKM